MKYLTALTALLLAGCQLTPVQPPTTDGEASAPPSTTIESTPAATADPPTQASEHPPAARVEPELAGAAALEVDFYTWLTTRGRLPACPAGSETDRHARWYAKHRRNVDEALKRAEPLLPFIREAIDDADITPEVALLPVLESGYQIAVRARDGPAGLWQFTAATARDRGLRVDRQVDERLDPMLATDAAIGLYRSLRERFGADPILAVAGFNMGAEALSRRLGTDPLPQGKAAISHPRFPKTTRLHLGRWVGLSCLLKHPARYGYQPPPLATRPAWTLYRLPAPMDERLITALADGSAAEMRARNPHLSSAGPPRRYALVLPQTLRASLETVHWPALQSGEHWQLASAQAEVSIAGRGLRRVAAQSVGSDVADAGPVNESARPASARLREITVRRGDNLWDLARSHQTTVAALAAANSLRTDQSLRPGLKLQLPEAGATLDAGAATTPTTTPGTRSYTIVSGDSLWLIAKRFGTTVERLLSLNQLSRRARLRPGQKLVLPAVQGP